MTVDVSDKFRDPDNDPLIYTASSSNGTIASVSVLGSVVSISPESDGRATVTVEATDPGDLTATQDIEVTVNAVNRPPEAVGSIAAQVLTEDGSSVTVDVSDKFRDPDNDILTYSATSSNASIARASVGDSSSVVTVTPESDGHATVTVEATDPGDLTATQDIEVTVEIDTSPVFSGNVSNQTYTQNSEISPLTLPSASDGNGDIIYTLSPDLPAGLSLSDRTISGTPEVVSATMYTYKAEDSDTNTADSDADTRTFTITVNPSPLSLPSISDKTATQGNEIPYFSVSASGGRTPYSYSPLFGAPSGITLFVYSNAGYINGTPTQSGSFSIMVTVTDADGTTTSTSFTMTVNPADTRPIFPENVVIPNQTYTLNHPITDLVLPSASDDNGDIIYTLSPDLPAGLSLSGRTISGTPTEAVSETTYTWKTEDSDDNRSDSDADTRTFTITVNPSPLSLPSVSDKTATQGKAITYFSVSASGGRTPYRYSLSGAPSGINLLVDSNTGYIYGFPTKSGSFSITVKVTDAYSATDSTSFKMTVNSSSEITIEISHSTMEVGLGEEIPEIIVNVTGPVTGFSENSITGRPNGIKVRTNDNYDEGGIEAFLFGKPTEAGSFTVTVTVQDDAGDAVSRSFTITVNGPPVIMYPGNKKYYQGEKITPFPITVTDPEDTPTVTVEGLPDSLNYSDGIVSGKVSKIASVQTYPVTIRTNDGVNSVVIETFTISVNSSSITIEFVGIESDTVAISWGEEIPEIIFTVEGGTRPYDDFNVTGRPNGIEAEITNNETDEPEARIFGKIDEESVEDQMGYFPITVTVRSGSIIKGKTIVLSVLGINIPISSKSFLKDQRITDIQVSATGGKPPYTFEFSGVVPTDISISSSGVISGTPTETGKFKVPVKVTDDTDKYSNYSFPILVYSRELAEKFSPILIMTENPNEPDRKVIFPESVEIMEAQSVDGLWFSFTVNDYTYQDMTQHRPDVLTYYQNQYPDINFAKNQFASIPEVLLLPNSLLLGPRSFDVRVKARFEYPGDNQFSWNSVYTGSGLQSGAEFANTAYVYVSEEDDGQFLIQYYYFYPFNDFQNNHEGDWQGVDVIVTSLDTMTAQLSKIDYKFHGNRLSYEKKANGRIFNPREAFAPAEGGTHPVVYVGVGSHGKYPTGGIYVNPNPEDDKGKWYQRIAKAVNEGIKIAVKYAKKWIKEEISSSDGVVDIYIAKTISESIPPKLAFALPDIEDEFLTKSGVVLSTSINDASFSDSIAQSYNLIFLPNPDVNQPNKGLPPEMSWLGAKVRWGTLVVDSPGNQHNHSPLGPFHNGSWGRRGGNDYDEDEVPYNLIQTVEGTYLANFSPTRIGSGGSVFSGYQVKHISIDFDSIAVDKHQQFPIVQDVTWSDTIDLIGDIVIYPGATLRIETGTTIRVLSRDIHFMNDDPLRVDIVNYGILTADASGGAPILFKSAHLDDINIDWAGIRNYGTLTMRNCEILDAVNGVATIDDGTETLENVKFINNTNYRKPLAPTLSKVMRGNEEVVLVWEEATAYAVEIDKYQYRQSEDNSTWSNWEDIEESATTPESTLFFRFRPLFYPLRHPVTGLTNGTTYYFQVRAVNSGDESAESNSLSAAPAAVPHVPDNFAVQAGNGQVIFTWYNPSDNTITGYQYSQKKGEGAWGSAQNIMGSGPTTVSHTVTGLDNDSLYVFTLQAVNSVGTGPHTQWVYATPRAALSKPALSDDAEFVSDVPDTFFVAQNFPNPYNPETTIPYGLPEGVHVRLVIYNVLGQEIRTLVNEMQPAGYHRVVWDNKDAFGRSVSNGVYLYRIVAGDFVQTKKMLILK